MSVEFRVIKSLDDKPYRNLYEMSADGQRVRKIGDEKDIKYQPGTTVRCELIDASGKKKSFGVKSLYWASWNRPLPEAALAGMTIKPSPIKTTGKKRFKSTLTVSAGALVSKFVLDKINEVCKNRLAMNSVANGIEVPIDKSHVLRILIHNPELQMVLIVVESQSWRNGYWFLNLCNGNHEAFEDKKHRRDGKYGDVNLIWPAL